MNERKNALHDLEQHRPTWRAFGFIAALSLVLAVFAWTSFESVYRSSIRYVSNSITEEELPDVRIKRKVSKPKPPVRQLAVVSTDPEPDPDPDPDQDDQDLTDFNYIEIDGGDEGEAYDDSDRIFVVVEKMPALGDDCARLRGDERKLCTENAILAFFAKNVQYPAHMKSARIEGVVFLNFIVDRDGKPAEFEILRSSHERFTNEVFRVAKRLPTFEPGEQHGMPVSVQYTIPVRFKLK